MKRLCKHCCERYTATDTETEPICMTCLNRIHADNVLVFRALGVTLQTNLPEDALVALQAQYVANIRLYIP